MLLVGREDFVLGVAFKRGIWSGGDYVQKGICPFPGDGIAKVIDRVMPIYRTTVAVCNDRP